MVTVVSQTSPKGLVHVLVAPRDFYVVDKNFAIILIHPKFLSLLLTDKICIGVTENIRGASAP